MQINQETGSKQHILAEDTLGNTIVPSLCDLFIATYADCIVMAVFSCLEKHLMAYKIMLPVATPEEKESWYGENFNRRVDITFTHEYEITPELFSTHPYPAQDLRNGILISYQASSNSSHLHYLTALIAYHNTSKTNNQIYLFCKEDLYTILLMNGEDCLLANTYVCKNEHEVLYFILNSLQISDILPSESTLNMDHSIAIDDTLSRFLSPHIAQSTILNYSYEGINPEIPRLAEKLFACHAASLCV